MDTEPVTDMSQLEADDTVIITTKLAPYPFSGDALYVPEMISTSRLLSAIARGEISRVVPPAPPEPDWQPGDIGQHVETGELFRYFPDPGHDPTCPDETPWLDCQRYRDRLGGGMAAWRSREQLAGRLKRMLLAPEDEVHS